MVSLLIKYVALEELQWLEFRDNSDYEIFSLVVEEVNLIYDLTVCDRYHLRAQLDREIVQQSLLRLKRSL